MAGERWKAILGAALLGMLCVAAAATASVKLSKSSAKVGFDPVDVAVGDFNRDGRDDLAVSNFAASGDPAADTSITILRGKKGGGFKPVKTLPSAEQPTDLVADRFGKGKELDLMAASYTGDALLYQGKKGFGFGAPTLTPIGSSARGAASGDFNGDHRADFAVTLQNPGGAVVVFYAQPGGTTFGSPKTFPGASSGEPLISARINRDKRPDLVTANDVENKLTVLLGKANGDFKKRSYAVPGPANPVVADFDQDKNADVAVISQAEVGPRSAKRGSNAFNSRLVVFDGSKKGKLKKKGSTKLKPFGKTRVTAMQAAQVDGDRDFDLAVGLQHSTLTKRGGGGPAFLQVFEGRSKLGFEKVRSIKVQGAVGNMAGVRKGKRGTVAVPIDVDPDNRGIVRRLTGR